MKKIIKSGNSELIIKKSKFYSSCFELESTSAFENKIKEFKQKYKDASHYPFAYRVIDDRKVLYEKYSDDSEPFGVAGVPMLNLIKNNLIINACIITARYFGGIKLGKGNLLGAYLDSAKLALKDSVASEIIDYTRYKIVTDYKNYQKIKHLIEIPEIEKEHIEFEKDVVVNFKVIKSCEEDIITKLRQIGIQNIIKIID